MSAFDREVGRAIYAIRPYGTGPVTAGPWWLGFNEAREGLPARPDYDTITSRAEYLKGYRTGRPSMRRDLTL